MNTLRHGVLVLLVTALCACTPGGGAELVTIYEAFEPPGGWALLSADQVSEPICLTADCQEVVARWATADAPSAEDLEALLSDAGYTVVAVDQDCAPDPDVTGPIAWCTADATADGRTVQLRATGPIPGESVPFQMVLRIS